MSAKRVLCKLAGFVLLLCLGHVNGTVTVTPSNTVVVAGNPMCMECRTTNGSHVYRWTIQHPTSSRDEFIFMNSSGKQRFGPKYTHYGVDVDEHGSGLLYLNATQMDDAGLYTCNSLVNNIQHQGSAYLIVLETEPFCETNYTSEDNATLTEGDIIWMQCKVNFRGIWSPTVEWKQHTENDKQNVDEEQTVIQGVSTETVFNNRVTTTYIHVVDLSKTTYFSCRVFFQWHNGSVEVTATNVPDYTYTCKFPRLLPHRVELETTSLVPLQVEIEPLRTTATKESGSNQWYLISLTLLVAVLVFVSLLVGLGIRRCVHSRRLRDLNMVYNASTSSTGPLRRLESSSSFVYDIITASPHSIYEGIDGAEEDNGDAAQAMTSCNSYPPLTECYSGLMAATGNDTCQYDTLDQYEKMDLCEPVTEDLTARKMPGCLGQEIGEERYTTPVPKRSVSIPNHPSGSRDYMYLLMVGNAEESKIGVKPLNIDISNNSDEDNYPGGKVKPLYKKDNDDYLQPGPKAVDNYLV